MAFHVGGIGGDPRLKQVQRPDGARSSDRPGNRPSDVAAKRAFTTSFEQAMRSLERANQHVRTAKGYLQRSDARPAARDASPPAENADESVGRQIDFRG